MLLLAACTSGEPVAMSPTESTQIFKVAASPEQVYLRVYDRLNACRVVHNLLDPGDIVGGVDRDGQHGRIYFANDGLALWGADLEASEGGTRVITRIGQGASSTRYHTLLRGWAEARPPPPPGEKEC